MPKIILIIIEFAIAVVAIWSLFFLSTFLHEAGHAVGYLLATGDMHWHIRVGSGIQLLNTRRLTVKLFPFDGFFMPSDQTKLDTKAKKILMLAGGPAVSLILAVILLIVRFGGLSLQPVLFTPSAVEAFINIALVINLCVLILALIPAHYFHGEIRGRETDGLLMIRILKSHTDGNEEQK